MPQPRLLALVTALLLVAGNSPARADYTISQLQEIERLILRKDCGALWQFLQANPAIMAGNDALAQELKAFADATALGRIECFAASATQAPPPGTSPVVSFAAQSPAY